ncbi:MAG TPA: glycosyltransferase, partial [Candidatus Dormibacteraeota bacterium]|nr:glycosyltransferase [Candidatus Dormibacteraeota bacterium]
MPDHDGSSLRIAFVCRDAAADSVTGVAAQVRVIARAAARAGHDVHVLAERMPHGGGDAGGEGGLRWTCVAEPRDGHAYFTERHGYADRVYDALRRLPPFDLVEFVDAGGEALTALRARRLLGEFPDTPMAVAHHPWASAARAWDTGQPLTLDPTVDAFTERYALERADAVLACSRLTADRLGEVPHARVRLRPPVLPLDALPPAAGPDPAAATTVLHL